MRIHLLIPFAALCITCACQNDAPSTPLFGSPLLRLSADIEQPQSRASQSSLFGSDGCPTVRTTISGSTSPHPILWSEGDIITVHFDTDPDGIMRLYQIVGSGNTVSATFEYLDSTSSNPDITTIPALPTSYNSLLAGFPGMFITITTTDQEIVLQTPVEIFQGLGAITDYAMVGQANASGAITFNSVFGIIGLSVTGNIAVTKITMDTSTQQKEVTGYFVLDPETYTATFQSPVLNHNQYTAVWASSQGGGLQLSSTPTLFYAVVPPDTYAAGTQFQFTMSNGTVVTKSTLQPFTVNRAELLNLPSLDVTQ